MLCTLQSFAENRVRFEVYCCFSISIIFHCRLPKFLRHIAAWLRRRTHLHTTYSIDSHILNPNLIVFHIRNIIDRSIFRIRLQFLEDAESHVSRTIRYNKKSLCPFFCFHEIYVLRSREDWRKQRLQPKSENTFRHSTRNFFAMGLSVTDKCHQWWSPQAKCDCMHEWRIDVNHFHDTFNSIFKDKIAKKNPLSIGARALSSSGRYQIKNRITLYDSLNVFLNRAKETIETNALNVHL